MKQNWAALALVAVLGAVIGASADWLVRGHDLATKDDIVNAILPIQRELDEHTQHLGGMDTEMKNIEINTGRIAEHDGVALQP